MSLLTIVQEAARRIGIVVPNDVAGSADPQVIQLIAIANQEGQSLADRYDWQVLRREAVFTSLAAESQGTLTSIASDFRAMVTDTFWNRSLKRPVYGCISPQDWQALKAAPQTGPFQQFILRGNEILMLPQPSAGQTCAFEYFSRNWCLSIDSAIWDNSRWDMNPPTVYQESYVLNEDTSCLDESIMLIGIIWRWKHIKGLEYAEDFRLYESRVMDAMARDKGATAIDMNGRPPVRLIGTVVPNGNWAL